MDVSILRQELADCLVGINGLLTIINGLVVNRRDQILFLWWQIFAQIDGLPGCLLSLIRVAKVRIGLPQLGVRQSKVAILLCRCQKTFLSLCELRLTEEVNPFAVIP